MSRRQLSSPSRQTGISKTMMSVLSSATAISKNICSQTAPVPHSMAMKSLPHVSQIAQPSTICQPQWEEPVAMICLVPSLLPLAYFPVQAVQIRTLPVSMAPIRPLPVMVTSIRSATSQIPAWKYVWRQRPMPKSAGLPVPMWPISSVKWWLPMVPTQAMASCVSPMCQPLAPTQPI